MSSNKNKFPHVLINLFLFFFSFGLLAQSFTTGTGISLSLCSDSTVMIWGNNTSYCGSDTTEIVNSSVPVPQSGLSGVIALNGGNSHSMALKADGTVWAWGLNSSGCVGDGLYASHVLFPVQAIGVSGISKIAGGFYHSMALKNDGTVWTWGDNEFGQLGNGSVMNTGCYCEPVPAQIANLSNMISIAGGWNHSVAVKNDGSVWSWGNNTKGQLGDGSGIDNPTPAMISGLTGITEVSCGRDHSLALKNDGTVWCWGDNFYGQIGVMTDSIGDCACQVIPTQLAGLTGVIAVSAGDNFSLALKNDGTVWAWGGNDYGQLGNGTINVVSQVAVQVSGLTGITSIKAEYVHSLALKNDGTLWAWGWNNLGQLGNGTTSTSGCQCASTPVMVNSSCPVLVAGIDEPEQVNIDVFPNPVKDHLFIQSEERIVSFTCVNSVGQTLDLELENGIMDVSPLSPGIYFLHIAMDKNRTVAKKFVKE
jgi:hypothetical protein